VSLGVLGLVLLGSAWAQDPLPEAQGEPIAEEPVAAEPGALPEEEPAAEPPVDERNVEEPDPTGQESDPDPDPEPAAAPLPLPAPVPDPSAAWRTNPLPAPAAPRVPETLQETRAYVERLEGALESTDLRIERLAVELTRATVDSDRIAAELEGARARLAELEAAHAAAEAEAAARVASGEPEPEPEPHPASDEPVDGVTTSYDQLGALTDLAGDTLNDPMMRMLAHGGFLGAQVGAAIGYTAAGDGDAATTAGLGGAVTLGLAGALAANEIGLGVDRAVAMNTSGLVAGWTGYQVGRIAVVESPVVTERVLAFGALGGLAGTAAGYPLGDLGVATSTWNGGLLGATAGWTIGAGASMARGVEARQTDAAIELGAGYAVGGAAFAAHHLGHELPPVSLSLLNMGQGAWIGAWSPLMFSANPPAGQSDGGALIGLGAGYLVANATAPLMEVDAKLLGLQTLGFATGTAVGAGIPLATGRESHPRALVIPMLAGGVLGHVGGSLLAPTYQLQQHDALLLPLLQGWAIYQAIGWGIYGADRGSGSQGAGFALTAAGTSTVAAWTVPAVIDLAPAQTVLAFSGSLWGTWYGAWSAYLLDVPDGRRLAPTLVAGNVGLVAAALPEAFGWRPSWSQVGVINGGGALGAGLGALVGVLASPDASTIGTASLIGTTAGLVGGGLAARGLDDGAAASAVDLVLPQPAWTARLPFRASFSAVPWTDDEGGTGALVQAQLHERRSR